MKSLFRTLRVLKKVIAREGVNFAVVIFPQRFQVQKRGLDLGLLRSMD